MPPRSYSRRGPQRRRGRRAGVKGSVAAGVRGVKQQAARVVRLMCGYVKKIKILQHIDGT